MAEILKPSNLSLTWASGGDILDPGNTKYATGWQVEIPPRQWFNYLDNRQDEAIAHINQHGIAVWDNVTEYQASKSYVQGSNGKIYVAIQTHTNQNPVTDVSEVFWAELAVNGLTIFTASTTWTVPAILKLGIKKPKVTVIGGGGGGGRGTATSLRGGGGGGGGRAIKFVDLTNMSNISITVGGGGAGTSDLGGTGTAGGSSSFGTFCSATGGGGGGGEAGAEAGGVSGAGVGGDLNDGLGDGSDGGASSGTGGGPGGRGSFDGESNGKGYGGGGGGVSSFVASSGSGATGVIIVEW